ncbi:MAG: PqqD family protein [Lachnospiraceae bacterium]|nr:PqqD family protein [Lachnospiraceae bacterium]
MGIRIRSKRNLLDYVPVKNKENETTYSEQGLVRIHIKRNSLFERFLRKFKEIPKEFVVKLDEFGTFVWDEIDSRKTIFEIGKAFNTRFNEENDADYARTAQFMKLLKNNNLITLVFKK